MCCLDFTVTEDHWGTAQTVELKPNGSNCNVINSNVDERYNIKLSTQVACQYLLKAKEKFGTWTLAAASYNAGMSRISSELERQSVSDYYDLLLGEETGRYIFRIVALKEIMTHPKNYGFNFEDKDLYTYAPTFEIEIDTPWGMKCLR